MQCIDRTCRRAGPSFDPATAVHQEAVWRAPLTTLAGAELVRQNDQASPSAGPVGRGQVGEAAAESNAGRTPFSTTLCRPGSFPDRAEGKLALPVALLPPRCSRRRCSMSYRRKEPSKSDPVQPLKHPCCGGLMFIIETSDPGRQHHASWRGRRCALLEERRVRSLLLRQSPASCGNLCQ
jgi:hypothetical protein